MDYNSFLSPLHLAWSSVDIKPLIKTSKIKLHTKNITYYDSCVLKYEKFEIKCCKS